MGPGTGGTEGTRTSLAVAGTAGRVGETGESVKDGLVARATPVEKRETAVRKRARVRRMA
jgi:hypothetical protein